MSRNKARTVAMQALYLMETHPSATPSLLEQRSDEEGLSKKDVAYLEAVLERVGKDLPTIDEWVRSLAIDWDLDRLGRVDRAILRLCIGELLHDPEMPPQIAVNEAVKLAKKYASAESSKFINGVLGKFVREILEPIRKGKVEEGRGAG